MENDQETAPVATAKHMQEARTGAGREGSRKDQQRGREGAVQGETAVWPLACDDRLGRLGGATGLYLKEKRGRDYRSYHGR